MHEITLVSPFPAGEGGRGDRGQESKLKAGSAGDKESKPPRHLLDLPRGRGPSQTPLSRATDSSISPGPPSPWLPALLKVKKFCRFCGEPRISAAGYLYGRFCKCRKRFNAGVPGAEPPAK